MSDEKNTTENIVHLTTPEFMYLLQRVDRLDEKFTDRIDNLSNRIDKLDEKFTSRIDALDEKFTSKITGLDGKLTGRIENLDEKFTNKIDVLRQEVKQDTSSIKTLIWATFGLMVGTIAIALTVAISLVK